MNDHLITKGSGVHHVQAMQAKYSRIYSFLPLLSFPCLYSISTLIFRVYKYDIREVKQSSHERVLNLVILVHPVPTSRTTLPVPIPNHEVHVSLCVTSFHAFFLSSTSSLSLLLSLSCFPRPMMT